MTKIINSNIDALALLDALPVGVIVHGPDTRILYANTRALAVLRLTAAQALGKVPLDFQWRLVDTYRQPMPIEQFPVSRVLATGKPVEGQLLGITDSRSPDVTWLTVNAMAESARKGWLSGLW